MTGKYLRDGVLCRGCTLVSLRETNRPPDRRLLWKGFIVRKSGGTSPEAACSSRSHAADVPSSVRGFVNGRDPPSC